MISVMAPQDGIDRLASLPRLVPVAANDTAFDAYRARVSERFARHHKESAVDCPVRCTCGREWPCAEERLAAQLLDWV
jgi:hypothetical protein